MFVCLCACALLLLGVCVRGCLIVCMCVRQTLSSVQQLVDIEPSPVSAMRMTLAQVVLTVVSIPILIPNINHGSHTLVMS